MQCAEKVETVSDSLHFKCCNDSSDKKQFQEKLHQPKMAKD